MLSTKKIALVGLPGSGKSTIGKILAKRLNYNFIDSDEIIESYIGHTIGHYFATHGEVAFRELEQQMLQELLLQSKNNSIVLSTGGGIVLNSSNRELLKSNCIVIYLKNSPEDLYKRLKHDRTRPLLQVDEPLLKLQELFATRHPLYNEVAHFTIEPLKQSVTVTSMINRIVAQLELASC